MRSSRHDRSIGIAIIGLGPASQPHSKSLLDLADRVEVRWAVSRSAERAAGLRRAISRFRTTTDLDAVLADPAVDAVIVLTPPSSHLDVSERCLAAGKHVLVEKPLELTSARGAERLAAAARRAGKHLRRRAAASLPARRACGCRQALDRRRARQRSRRLPVRAVVAPAELLRRARTRHAGPRRRRRAADAGDPLARPVPLAGRRLGGRRRAGADDRSAPDGDGGLCLRRCCASAMARRRR